MEYKEEDEVVDNYSEKLMYEKFIEVSERIKKTGIEINIMVEKIDQFQNKVAKLKEKIRQKTGGIITEEFQDEATKFNNEYWQLRKKYLPGLPKLKTTLNIAEEDCANLVFLTKRK